MQKISSLVSSFIITLIALTASGVKAAIVGAINVVSTNPGVLAVSPNADGTWTATVVGQGQTSLTITADEDLINGIPPITQTFLYEVYDGSTEADHFQISIGNLAHVHTSPAAEAITTTPNPTANTASTGTVAAAPASGA